MWNNFILLQSIVCVHAHISVFRALLCFQPVGAGAGGGVEALWVLLSVHSRRPCWWHHLKKWACLSFVLLRALQSLCCVFSVRVTVFSQNTNKVHAKDGRWTYCKQIKKMVLQVMWNEATHSTVSSGSLRKWQPFDIMSSRSKLTVARKVRKMSKLDSAVVETTWWAAELRQGAPLLLRCFKLSLCAATWFWCVW